MQQNGGRVREILRFFFVTPSQPKVCVVKRDGFIEDNS